MRILLLIVAAMLFSQAGVFANRDSIGVKTIGGKLYILHKVARGQGLYSIGRRYNVSIPAIEKADPSVKDGLDPGDIIMIPSWERGSFKTADNMPSDPKTVTRQEPKKEQPKQDAGKPTQEVKKPGTEIDFSKPEVKKPIPEVKKPAQDDKSPRYYVVNPGETLFAIAKKHNISVAEIQKWNGLKDNSIATGQKLIVGYTITSYLEGVPSQIDMGPDGADKNPNLRVDHIDEKITKEYEDAQKKLDAERRKNKIEVKEVNESGVATWIDDGTVVSEKKLALHRTAPPGTIVQLTNPRTGKRVFVKVIGKLPDAVEEQNVLIKVTKNTAVELGAIDSYFRVDMKYGVEVFSRKK